MLKDVTSHERDIFINNLNKQFGVNEISKAETNDDDSIEKAKHQIGDTHPKWPQLKWTDLGGGKFGWRTGTGRGKRASTGSTGNAGGTTSQTPQTSQAKPEPIKLSGGKLMSSINGGLKYGKKDTDDSDKTVTWDKLSSFNKKGSDENKLWDAWYKYQTTGDPSNMSKFRDILAKKFPNVSSWSQTSPNTGKSIITAKDDNGKEIASIDLSGNSIDIPKLQTFMDKCHKVVKSDKQSKTTENSISNKIEQLVGNHKTSDFNVKFTNDKSTVIIDGVSKKILKDEKFKTKMNELGFEYDGYISDGNSDVTVTFVKSTTKYSPNMRKLIDAFRISSNKYTDPEKMSITTTPKGNWELRYDGKRVSVIGSLDIDRDEFDDLGITIN